MNPGSPLFQTILVLEFSLKSGGLSISEKIRGFEWVKKKSAKSVKKKIRKFRIFLTENGSKRIGNSIETPL